MGFAIGKNQKEVEYVSMSGANVKTPVGVPWKNGVVYIYFHPTTSKKFYEFAVTTLRRWRDVVNKHFNSNVIDFQTAKELERGVVEMRWDSSQADIGNRFWSPKVDGQRAGVWVDNNQISSLPHEFGHMLGLAHEHESPLAPAVITDNFGEFDRYVVHLSKLKHETHGTKFDPLSIMMYPRHARLLKTAHLLNKLENTKLGGCVISEKQVEEGTWYPSQGDLDVIGILYGAKK